MSITLSDNDVKLLLEKERLKTFKLWPNDPEWSCTPEKLANAGFYFHPSEEAIDNVCCAFCFKELDGWEPEDDPIKEHQRHSPHCPFLTVRKPVEDLITDDFLKLVMNITILKTKKILEVKRKEFQAAAKDHRQMILENNSVV